MSFFKGLLNQAAEALRSPAPTTEGSPFVFDDGAASTIIVDPPSAVLEHAVRELQGMGESNLGRKLEVSPCLDGAGRNRVGVSSMGRVNDAPTRSPIEMAPSSRCKAYAYTDTVRIVRTDSSCPTSIALWSRMRVPRICSGTRAASSAGSASSPVSAHNRTRWRAQACS